MGSLPEDPFPVRILPHRDSFAQRRKDQRHSTGATGFLADFSVLRDFLATKPYVDTARSEKSRRDEKDPESLCGFLLAPVL
jgi:hypothetical protein